MTNTTTNNIVHTSSLLLLAGLALLSFVFTLYSLELSLIGSVLAPLWFPTSIMMVAFFRHPIRLWPFIAIACSAGSLTAAAMLFPVNEIKFVFTIINIVEALTGALLMRRFLAHDNPLQNLNSWVRMSLCSATIPPLIGGTLAIWLTGAESGTMVKTFFVWVLSEAIGALALMPTGLLFKPRYLLSARHPKQLLETAFTFIVTLLLSYLALRYMPWPFTFIIVFLMWSAIRLPRLDAFIIFLGTLMVVSAMMAIHSVAMEIPHVLVMDNAPWLPFLMILLPANVMTMVMYSFREERKHIIESEARFRNAMEYSAIGMALVAVEGQWIQVNKSLCHFLGYSAAELRSLTFQQITYPEDLNADLIQLDKLVAGELNSYSLEKRYYTSKGEVVWALLAVSVVRDTDGSPLYLIAQIEDINDLKHTEWVNQRLMKRITLANEALYQEKERLHITLDSIGEAVICTDIDMNVTFMNPVAERLSGWPQESAIGQHILSILRITFGNNGPMMENIHSGDFSRMAIEQDMVLHCRNGDNYDIHYSITPLTTLDGLSIGSVLVIQDVTESRKMLKQLSYSASHDGLTHLANRVSFENHLKRLLQSAGENRQRHALVFIDLDRFKAVNDSAGHAAGDALLRELSALMQSMLRAGDFLARLGGDEFGLLLPDCSALGARAISERIIKSINDYHFVWEGRLHRIGASAGITQMDAENRIASEVLSQADIACYASKHGGRGRVSIYEAQQPIPTSRNTLSVDEQWRVINDNPLLMIAQAIAPPRVPESTSFYLLQLRFRNSSGEVLDEKTFRSGIVDSGLHRALDRRVFNEFFSEFAPQIALKGFGVALPLSSAGLASNRLIDELIHLINRSPLPSRLLHLQIGTDGITMTDEHIANNLQRLRQLGCQLVLTRVGRDLDIFDKLNRQDFAYLIVDSELIENIHADLMNEMMVTIIHGHARRLKIQTIAGPADSPLAMDTLSGVGIDMIYGETLRPPQPLSMLLSTSYFAIN